LVTAAAALGGWFVVGDGPPALLWIVAGAALAAGVLLTLPIGGADMPVVISMLNACTGTAVAMAGFVLGSTPLIIAGGLVGAAGAILTKLMADAMNRPVSAILAGGYGTGDAAAAGVGTGSAAVREITADDAAIQLAYASKVVIVPGYGLAAAQAQHEVVALAEALTRHGVDVSYAIHPVAGRMPGHMNVLLAEANAPYEQLHDLDESNAAFARTDVALVVGANDVTNPAARRPGNPVSGMPILDVDRAKSVIVLKRSLGHGYAGIDNELYTEPRTAMLFADAKAGLSALLSSLHTYAG
jgi:NAD(P) transhydrogenase subunit beta